MPPYRTKVIEDPHPERDYGRDMRGNLRFPLIGALAGSIHGRLEIVMHVRDERPCSPSA